MKYTRLTKEQLEELHPEFATFLATQSIDAKDWETTKAKSPEVALKVIDVFSDFIWEKAMDNVNFIDHFSKNHIFLFACKNSKAHSYVVKSNNPGTNFLTQEGINWLSENIFSDEIEIQNGFKDFKDNRNQELFKLIEKGGIISKGELYKKLKTLLTQ